jgi:hypothetical protein
MLIPLWAVMPSLSKAYVSCESTELDTRASHNRESSKVGGSVSTFIRDSLNGLIHIRVRKSLCPSRALSAISDGSFTHVTGFTGAEASSEEEASVPSRAEIAASLRCAKEAESLYTLSCPPMIFGIYFSLKLKL